MNHLYYQDSREMVGPIEILPQTWTEDPLEVIEDFLIQMDPRRSTTETDY